jgi:hypothetical protein
VDAGPPVLAAAFPHVGVAKASDGGELRTSNLLSAAERKVTSGSEHNSKGLHMKLRLTCLRSIIRRVVRGVILITAPSVCVTRAKEQAVVAATPVPIFCAVFPREGGSLPEGLAVIPSSDVSRRFATSFRFLLS